MFFSAKIARVPCLKWKPDLEKPRKQKGQPCRSVVVLFGGDGDQLDVRGWARVPREGLLAF